MLQPLSAVKAYSHAYKIESNAGDILQDVFSRRPLEALWYHSFATHWPVHTGPLNDLIPAVDDISALGAQRSIWPHR